MIKNLREWIKNKLPIVDIRNNDKYCKLHIKGSASIPLNQLQNRLHELPTKDVSLWIVGDKDTLKIGLDFLNKRQHIIGGQIDDAYFDTSLCQSGSDSKNLWQANPFLKEIFTTQKLGSTAIDIGCGSGRDLIFMAQNNKDVFGIDYKPQALEKAQNLAKINNVKIKTILHDIEKTPLEIAPADMVIVMRYLHRPLFNKIKNWIKPNGHIIYQTFLEGCQKFGSPKRPCFLLKPNELASIFNDFDIIVDRVDNLPDGRPVNSFCARKNDFIGI